MPLRAATRGSALARWQTDHVAELLAATGSHTVEPVVVETTGDRIDDVPLWVIGGQGVFVKEVQAAVLDGRADFAVHSAKDLPSAPTPGLRLVVVPERADPRDALVGCRLHDLPAGARVATGSVRRRAQLAALRPDLTFTGLRGNIETRLAKAADHEAVVVAYAALVRLGLADRATDVLSPADVLPQVAQGALAIECRSDDTVTAAALAALDHRPTHRAVLAERAYLARLGSGCDLPVGALALADADGPVTLTAVLGTLDGRVVLRHAASGDDPERLGAEVADHLLWRAGGWSLLDERRSEPATEVAS